MIFRRKENTPPPTDTGENPEPTREMHMEGTALEVLNTLFDNDEFLTEALAEAAGPELAASVLAQGKLQPAIVGAIVKPRDQMMVALALMMTSLEGSLRMASMPRELQGLADSAGIGNGHQELMFNSAGLVETNGSHANLLMRMIITAVLTGLAIGEGRSLTEVLDELVEAAPDDDAFNELRDLYLQDALERKIAELNAIPVLDHDPDTLQ